MGKTIEITIEPMRKEDLDQVMDIEQASFTMPWSRNLFLSELRSRTVASLLVALRSGLSERRVLGYVIYWLVADEMHILNLATAPEERRQGIGRKLVLEAIKEAVTKGARLALLEVRVSNNAAQKLYSDLGFSGIYIRRGYYDLPVEDALVMSIAGRALSNLVNRTE